MLKQKNMRKWHLERRLALKTHLIKNCLTFFRTFALEIIMSAQKKVEGRRLNNNKRKKLLKFFHDIKKEGLKVILPSRASHFMSLYYFSQNYICSVLLKNLCLIFNSLFYFFFPPPSTHTRHHYCWLLEKRKLQAAEWNIH